MKPVKCYSSFSAALSAGLLVLMLSAVGLLAFTNAAKPKPRFIHSVYFWMNEEASPETIKQFEEGLIGLAKVKTVRKLEIGKPAGTPRDVVDNTYQYALILYFDDAAGQDAYQIDKIHTDFVARSSNAWKKVLIYDAILE
jgi:hypothetical protein